MDIHKNARLTPHSRGELVRRVLIEGQNPKAVAMALGVCFKTVRKWVERFQVHGEAGLQDRSSRPHRLYRPTPLQIVGQIERLRRERRPASYTSFKRHCASGHMPKPIQHQIIVKKSCRSGFIATIGTDLMVVSKHKRPSAASA